MVARDCEIRGVKMKRGDRVTAILPAANYDPEVFPHPTEADFHRRRKPILAFAGGPHSCMGAHLARLDLRVFWRQFAERFESIELTGPVKLLHASFVGGPKRLPVRYRVRALG